MGNERSEEKPFDKWVKAMGTEEEKAVKIKDFLSQIKKQFDSDVWDISTSRAAPDILYLSRQSFQIKLGVGFNKKGYLRLVIISKSHSTLKNQVVYSKYASEVVEAHYVLDLTLKEIEQNECQGFKETVRGMPG